MNIKENIDVLFEKFENFIKSETVIGSEIKIGDITIIPLSSISFTLGAGGGSGKDKNGSGGDGGGSGIAAKASPTALLVVNNGDIKIMPIKKGNSFESLLEAVPNLIDKIKENSKKDCCDTGECEC